MTFLKNHMQFTAACDFFVVPSITFTRRYVFVVLSHDRRRIAHVGVTAYATAAWTARQIVEAFPAARSRACRFATTTQSTTKSSRA